MKIFEKIRYADGRRKIYFCGINVINYTNGWYSKFQRLWRKRFDGLNETELKYIVTEQFRRWHGYLPDLQNPKTFNEKLTWEKLYYRNPLMTICADKVKARDYFIKTVKADKTKLVKQFGVYKNADEIDIDALPNAFVLKSNWGSGQQIIVKDKAKFDFDAAKPELNRWMRPESNHYFACFETGYKDIEPRIVCEEFLDFEYKLEFFCFNGQPRFFWIVLDDKTKNTRANFYDLNWNKMSVENHYPNFDEEIQKPKCYDELLAMSKKLCGDFPFVRCDYYITKDDFRFSEMTFFHWGASQGMEPVEFERIIGDMMILPKK